MLAQRAIERALGRLRRSTAKRYWRLWLLRDCERLLPSAGLLDELQSAGLVEVATQFAAIEAKLTEIRRELLQEEN